MNKPPAWVQDYEGLTRYGGADDETRFMTAEYANALEAKARWAEEWYPRLALACMYLRDGRPGKANLDLSAALAAYPQPEQKEPA